MEKLFSLIGGRSVLFHRQLEGLPLILNYENGTLERMEVYCPQNTLPKQSTVYRIRQLWNVPMTIPYRESLKVGGCVVLSGRWKSHQTTLLAQILASKVPDVASRWEQFRFLATNGFTTVDYALLAADAPMSALQAILKQYRSGVFSPPTNRFIFEYNDLVNTPGLKFCFPK